jgi:ferrous-iron efflux pump FieF
LFEAHTIGEAIELEIIEALAPCEVFIHHDPLSAANHQHTSDEIKRI